jgi:hypothetical protein
MGTDAVLVIETPQPEGWDVSPETRQLVEVPLVRATS